VHLLAAQRELLLAVSVTIEHHMRAQRAAGSDGKQRRRRPVKVDLE
jgi:hypothetical protein